MDKRSFELLVQKVTEHPMLSLTTFTKVFQVDNNTSENTIGALLSSEGIPIDYFSQELNDVKKISLV